MSYTTIAQVKRNGQEAYIERQCPYCEGSVRVSLDNADHVLAGFIQASDVQLLHTSCRVAFEREQQEHAKLIALSLQQVGKYGDWNSGYNPTYDMGGL